MVTLFLLLKNTFCCQLASNSHTYKKRQPPPHLDTFPRMSFTENSCSHKLLCYHCCCSVLPAPWARAFAGKVQTGEGREGWEEEELGEELRSVTRGWDIPAPYSLSSTRLMLCLPICPYTTGLADYNYKGKTRSNGYKLKQDKFRLKIRCTFVARAILEQFTKIHGEISSISNF